VGFLCGARGFRYDEKASPPGTQYPILWICSQQTRGLEAHTTGGWRDEG